MRGMSESTTETQSDSGVFPDTAGGWMALVGFLTFAVGVVGTVLILSEMNSSGLAGSDYSTIDRWLASFAGLTVAALGLIVAGVGMVLGRLEAKA